MVAQAMGTELSELCMIAAHPWDLIGASTAGCSVALIARAGVAPLIVPGLKQPQIIAPTLTEIAAQLVQLRAAALVRPPREPDAPDAECLIRSRPRPSRGGTLRGAVAPDVSRPQTEARPGSSTNEIEMAAPPRRA
jgi:hypothetical protein